MFDPRIDLKQDHMLWELVLACATQYQDKQIFGNLHGFRCGGAHLILKDNNLLFQLPKDWPEEMKFEFKTLYIMPYIKQIKEVLSFIAYYITQKGLSQYDNID